LLWEYDNLGLLHGRFDAPTTPESQVTKLVPLSDNPVISVFSFQVTASRLTAFHALRLTGLWRALAHSVCSKHQNPMKQATTQAVTSSSEYPFTFLS